MDLPQRFTGDEHFYEMEENFLEELETLPPLYSAGIIMQLDKLASEMHEEKNTLMNQEGLVWLQVLLLCKNHCSLV